MCQIRDREHAQYLEGGHSDLDNQPARLSLGVLTPAAVARCALPSSGANEARGPLARILFDGVLHGRGTAHLHRAGELQRRFELRVSG